MVIYYSSMVVLFQLMVDMRIDYRFSRLLFFFIMIYMPYAIAKLNTIQRCVSIGKPGGGGGGIGAGTLCSIKIFIIAHGLLLE